MQVRQQSLIAQKGHWDKLGVIADRPKYPQYSSLERRIKSFAKWPEHMNQTPIEMAEAGFAHTGVDDAVRCYHCGNGLRDWEADDIPWKQHALHFRQCAHVRQCKGNDYIRWIHGETDLEVDGESADDGGVKEMIETNNVAVTAAKEFDVDDKKIEEAMKYFINRKMQVVTAVDLLKAIEEIERDGIDTKPKTKTPTESTDSESYSDIKQENESLKDPFTCKICYDARACIVTIPCGHMVTCAQCIGPLQKCCVCRSPIEGTVRAFMAD